MDKYSWMIGPLMSIAGSYLVYRRKDVGRRMQQRRIDGRTAEPDLGRCDICGEPMRRIKTLTGKRAGQEAPVCKRYPDCSFVRWGR